MKRYILALIVLFCSIFALSFANFNTSAATLTPTGPTSNIWYFAEGRVGGGFKQWLTVSNPNLTDCKVNTEYDYTIDGTTNPLTKNVSFTVGKLTRHTENVNADLGISPSNTNGAVLSSIVSSSDCAGIVAERPMYFTNFHGTSSGTDVFGAPQTRTSWYFSDIPRKEAGNSFISIFNPNTLDTKVDAKYYIGGLNSFTQTITVKAHSRGTFFPNDFDQLTSNPHTAAVISSDLPIVAERPTYYVNVHGVSGSADVMGTYDQDTTWTFAAGTISTGNVEELALSNVSNSDVTAKVEIDNETGIVKTQSILVPANGQNIFNVNSALGNPNLTSISLIVTSESPILAQRTIYSNHTATDGWVEQGVSSSHGVAGTLTVKDNSTYNFAEGFTSVAFEEILEIVNTNDSDIQVTISLNNMLGQTDAGTITIPKHSKQLFNVNNMVSNSGQFTLSDVQAYAVSATVFSDKPFAVDRAMYWNAFGTQGTNANVGFHTTTQE
jgi:hypothetical protein